MSLLKTMKERLRRILRRKQATELDSFADLMVEQEPVVIRLSDGSWYQGPVNNSGDVYGTGNPALAKRFQNRVEALREIGKRNDSALHGAMPEAAPKPKGSGIRQEPSKARPGASQGWE